MVLLDSLLAKYVTVVLGAGFEGNGNMADVRLLAGKVPVTGALGFAVTVVILGWVVKVVYW